MEVTNARVELEKCGWGNLGKQEERVEFEKGKELPKLREKGKFSASGMEKR